MTSQSRAAYLAGFMDGEGSFSIVKTRQIRFTVGGSEVRGIRYQLHIKITNTHENVLKWISANFGGQISAKKLVKHWKPKWELTVTGSAKMERFVLSILPYLIVKREQALVALEFIKLFGQEVPEQRAELRQKMRALNKSKQPHPESPEANMPNTIIPIVKIESELIGDYESDLAVTQVS